MTFLELLLAAGVLALVLAIVNGLYSYGLNQAKLDQASALVASLDRAVRTYAEVSGAYPPGRPDGALVGVLPALLAVPESKTQLKSVSPTLLYVVDGRVHCRDPWGQPLRCLTPRVTDSALARRVELNGEVPVFECAGPDRSFGDGDPARQADNIRSDEPLDID
jgi:type II secretory pathway pseudopilin PulG